MSLDLNIHLTAPKTALDSYHMYSKFFRTLDCDNSVVYDRGHLGEIVYSPIYRNLPGWWVFDMESYIAWRPELTLILLTTDNFEMIPRDGLNIKENNEEYEQKKFVEAFKKSKIKDKRIVKVNHGTKFRDLEDIIKDIL